MRLRSHTARTATTTNDAATQGKRRATVPTSGIRLALRPPFGTAPPPVHRVPDSPRRHMFAFRERSEFLQAADATGTATLAHAARCTRDGTARARGSRER